MKTRNETRLFSFFFNRINPYFGSFFLMLLMSVFALLTSGCPNAGLLFEDIQQLVNDATTQIDQVETPVFDPLSGSYPSDQIVTISCSTIGAAIYYTDDGSRPDMTDTEYSGPIPVEGDGTKRIINAVAVREGMINSEVVSEEYTIDYSLTTYTLHIESGPNGTVTQPSLSSISVSHGVAESLSAEPASGYDFDTWSIVSGSGISFGSEGAAATTVTLTGGDATIKANFTETQHPIINITFEGSSVSEGEIVYFGSTYLNDLSEAEFTITNSYPSGGEQQVLDLDGSPELIQLQGSNPDIGMFSVSQQPSKHLLVPQDSTNFKIQFTPTTIDTTLESEVIISCNDPDHDPFIFTISGEGTGTKYVSSLDDWGGAKASIVTKGLNYFIATAHGSHVYDDLLTTFSSTDAGVSWNSTVVLNGSANYDTPNDIELRGNPVSSNSLYLGLLGNYQTNFSLFFAESSNGGNSWNFDYSGFGTVPLVGAMDISVEGTGADSIYICYAPLTVSPANDIVIRRFTNPGWSDHTVITNRYFTSTIAVDGNVDGFLYLLYANSDPDGLNPRLEFIACEDMTNYDNWSWSNNTGRWLTSGITTQDANIYSAGSGQNTLVTFYDVTNGDLCYMTNYGSAVSNQWSVVNNLDSSGNVGLGADMMYDSSTFTTYVSYIDVTNGNLKLARSVGSWGSWSITTVDDSGDVSTELNHAKTSISVEGSKVIIAYPVGEPDPDSDHYALSIATSLDGGITW